MTSTTLIKGNTYPVKDALKALGAKWDPQAKGWLVPEDKADEARALVANAPAPTKKPSNSTKAPALTKRCWECGYRFTQAEARQYGGDWADGYCGC
jgi:hypothetical protein